MRLLGIACAWICEACRHRNPPYRFACRKCRTERPMG